MTTIRVRLTLWYAALFLLAGIVLLVLVNVLVERAMPAADRAFAERVLNRPLGRAQLGALARQEALQVAEQARIEARDEALDALLVRSSMALGVMLVASVGAGWFIAGRMLRPVASITETARRIDSRRLDERIALRGPRDELKELADQFDAMLDRLDGAFRAQREFVANASHELRTPLSIIRTELDVTLADPDATAADLRQSAEVIRRATSRSEALIAALLTLERADAPRQADEEVHLAQMVVEALERRAGDLRTRDIEVARALGPAHVRGDWVLLEQLVENLLANATAYCEPDAAGRRWLAVRTGIEDGMAVLRVTNSSRDVDAVTLDGLFERFRRIDGGRSRENGGHGLGLSIVRAVARHHAGDVRARALEGPAVEFEVAIPAAM
ncbi:MAG: sensor histidine kinase [Dehalococcoidia bacterium]